MGTMNLANKITVARIISVPFFVAAVIYARMDIAFIVFVIAVISDGVDGLIARTFNQKTALGAILDPIADKLLLMSAYIALSSADAVPGHLRMPPYVPIVVISRDVIIVIGSLIVHLVRGKLTVRPSVTGKITTFFQMLTIVVILVQWQYAYLIWNATVALTLISGIGYVVRGSRLLGNGNHPAAEEIS